MYHSVTLIHSQVEQCVSGAVDLVQNSTFMSKCVVCVLLRKIKEVKARIGCVSPPPDVLMKVLSGSTTVSLTFRCPIETRKFIKNHNY